MKPISQERVDWLNERNRVLDALIHLLQANLRHAPHRMDLRQAVMTTEGERAANLTEITVLQKTFGVVE